MRCCRRGAARADRSRRWWRGTASASTRRWWRAACWRFEDALPLVRYRAQAMQEAVPEGTGGIAAILGLDDAGIRAVCADAAQGQVLEAANFNAPVPGRDRRPPRGGAAGDGAGQGEGRETSHAAADERTVSLQLDAGCRQASGRAARGRTSAAAAHARAQQRRRGVSRAARPDQGQPGAPALPSCALGRVHAGDAAAGHCTR